MASSIPEDQEVSEFDENGFAPVKIAGKPINMAEDFLELANNLVKALPFHTHKGLKR